MQTARRRGRNKVDLPHAVNEDRRDKPRLTADELLALWHGARSFETTGAGKPSVMIGKLKSCMPSRSQIVSEPIGLMLARVGDPDGIEAGRIGRAELPQRRTTREPAMP